MRSMRRKVCAVLVPALVSGAALFAAAQGLGLAQRRGLEVLFLLRRPEGLVEMGLGRFGASIAPQDGG